MDDKIDITGIDKPLLLACLYNRSQPLGNGFLSATSEAMTREQAAELLDATGEAVNFDYVRGRVLKVGFDGNTLHWAYLYDREAGEGACRKAVEQARRMSEARQAAQDGVPQ